MNSAAWGFLLAFIFGSLFSLMFSFFTVKLKSDQIVIGTGFNLLIAGLIPFISKFLFNSTGSTPSLPVEIRFSYEPLVFSVLTVVLVHLFLNKMRAGYWIQFAGEHPETLLSAGVSVPKIRTWSLFFCGGIAALGGASLSLFLSSNYSPLMTGGRNAMFAPHSHLLFLFWLPQGIFCFYRGVDEWAGTRI
jgi:simple sugar transport system permease protein